MLLACVYIMPGIVYPYSIVLYTELDTIRQYHGWGQMSLIYVQ